MKQLLNHTFLGNAQAEERVENGCRYSIDDLAEKGDFIDATYLLLHGELPTKVQREKFNFELTHHSLVHEQLIKFFQGFKHDAHPMAIMVGVVGALAAFYSDSADIGCAP